MAPTRSKKRKSTESQTSIEGPTFPAPSQTMNAMAQSPARTPTGKGPGKKGPMRITANQKQALIDNLQLEITERARKLRAQYTMQTQGLRTRIEIRVNRIPMALRKANMGELFLKHNDASKQSTVTVHPMKAIRSAMMASPSKNLIQESQCAARQSPSPTRFAKRLSDEVIDKENDDLLNPKKRVKGPVPAQNPSRARLQPDQVLSPRSANSRTLPRSPAHPALSPAKSYLARPVSPYKLMGPPAVGTAGVLTSMVEKAKFTRAKASRPVTASSSSSSSSGVGRGRRAPQPKPVLQAGKGRASNTSQSTDASSGTTIVSKGKGGYKSPVKKAVIGAVRGIKGTAAKKTGPAKAPAPATRVLRSRN